MSKKVPSVYDAIHGGKGRARGPGHDRAGKFNPADVNGAKLVEDGKAFWDAVADGSVKLVAGGEILPTDTDKPSELQLIGAAATSLTPTQVLVWGVRDEA